MSEGWSARVAGLLSQVRGPGAREVPTTVPTPYVTAAARTPTQAGSRPENHHERAVTRETSAPARTGRSSIGTAEGHRTVTPKSTPGAAGSGAPRRRRGTTIRPPATGWAARPGPGRSLLLGVHLQRRLGLRPSYGHGLRPARGRRRGGPRSGPAPWPRPRRCAAARSARSRTPARRARPGSRRSVLPAAIENAPAATGQTGEGRRRWCPAGGGGAAGHTGHEGEVGDQAVHGPSRRAAASRR